MEGSRRNYEVTNRDKETVDATIQTDHTAAGNGNGNLME